MKFLDNLYYHPVMRFFRKLKNHIRLIFRYFLMFIKAVFKGEYLLHVNGLYQWADEDEALLQTNFQLFMKVLKDKARQGFWSENWKREQDKLKPLPNSHFEKNLDKYIRDSLEWASSLDGEHLPEWERVPHQAEAARISFEIYNWWTVTRPNRLDPMSLIDDKYVSEDWIFNNKPLDDTYRQQLKESSDLEEAYRNEDDAMLKRIIDIRGSLWT